MTDIDVSITPLTLIPVTICALAAIAAIAVFAFLAGWRSGLARVAQDPDMRRRLDIAPVAHTPWIPTHRHRKGGLYQELLRGFRETDLEPVVSYKAKDGTVWSRPVREFDDGRFTSLTDAHVPAAVETGSSRGADDDASQDVAG